MRQHVDEKGLVSLFTAIIISLLLLVITVSLISLQTLQLRKAVDAEQTLRAYYAAEAGVEDAVSKVLAGTVSTDQACSANMNYDIPGAAGWTCQQISFSGTPEGRLTKPDQAQTIDPGPVNPNYRSILIEWGQSTSTAAAQFTTALPFQSQAAYSAAVPPLEVQIVEYPRAGFASTAVCTHRVGAAWQPAGCSVKLQNVLIVPGGAAGAAAVNYPTIFNNAAPTTNFRGNCRPLPRTLARPGTTEPSNYNCFAIISNLVANQDYLLRLRARYQSTAYRVRFFASVNGAGQHIDVPDGTATIDVTAKAGQTYRRVISKLPLGKGASAGLNYVMYSDGDVCKNFDVIDNVAQPGCPY
jgi:Tfp pilus assembly protein PilX